MRNENKGPGSGSMPDSDHVASGTLASGPASPKQEQPPEIRIGKTPVPAEVDGQPTELNIFTMALGEEAIYLLPLKTWSQLDVHKWRTRGKLPGTPPGLAITVDLVKLGGESVSTDDPDGCAKLERAFNQWLTLERQAQKGAKKDRERASQPTASALQEETLRFQVDLDKTGQAHIRCFEGNELVSDVACTVPGITRLLNDGFMCKPATWKVGALRDWLELDGEIFRLNDGKPGLEALQRVLNTRYHPAEDSAVHVQVYENPASMSGFDIEFPAAENGLTEIRRRHLDPEAMELLSDPHRCRVLRKGVVVKFTPPTFYFKEKTDDGGERDLKPGPMIWVDKAGGQKKGIDLSRPLSHLGLQAKELTAIFNHPSICRRVRRSNDEHWQSGLDKAA